MSDAEEADRVADRLSEATLVLERVDLNALRLNDDVRALLDAKEDLEDMCLRYRRASHHDDE